CAASDTIPEACVCAMYHRKTPNAQRVILNPEASERDTCPRVLPPGDFLQMSPSTPPDPECLTRKPHPGALRVRRVSRGHSRRELPRMLPSPPRVPRGQAPRAPPGSSPSGPCPESPLPGALRVGQPESPLPRALREYAT